MSSEVPVSAGFVKVVIPGVGMQKCERPQGPKRLTDVVIGDLGDGLSAYRWRLELPLPSATCFRHLSLAICSGVSSALAYDRHLVACRYLFI